MYITLMRVSIKISLKQLDMINIYSYIILFWVAVVKCERPEVITSVGLVAGYLKTSFGGKPYSAFEGIPYAKAPIGNRRFSPPEPADPWTGTWNATTLHECVQKGMDQKIIGLEDCLYINIYVPREQPLSIEKIDVIVHIHGGGFKMGSPHSYTLPDYLMDSNVIFVSLTYRLDIFGFLSTGDYVVSGNMGLKDQILALQWIKDNIHYFGGSPNSITLTGFSAGAASTHLLYLSPLTENLFNRGISHSGTAISAWAIEKNPLDKTKKLANLVGCEIESNDEMIECIKQRPATQLLNIANEISGNAWTLSFLPVIDGKVLPKNPINILMEDKLKEVPWIFSNTAQDGLFPGFMFAELLDHLNENWLQSSPSLLKFEDVRSETKRNEIALDIKKLYAGNDEKFSYTSLIDVLTDRYFIADGERAAKMQSKFSKSAIYYYYFNYFGGSTFTDLFSPTMKPELKGIGHGDDIIRLYGNVIPNAVITEEDKKVIEIMLDLLTSFANTGTPKVKDVKWAATSYEQLTYLNISGPTQVTVEKRNTISHMEFWEKISNVDVVVKDEL